MEKINDSTTANTFLNPLCQPEAQSMVVSLIESAGTAVFILEEGKFRYINKTFEELTGYTGSELFGTRSLDLVHHDDKEMVRTSAIEAIKGKELHRPYSYRLVKKDGKILWVMEKVTSAEYLGRKGTIGCFIDITQSKNIEEELKDSEERLKILFEYAPDAYYLCDLKGTFLNGNKAAENITGYKREELIGNNFLKLKLLSPDQFPLAARLLAKNALGYATGPDEFSLNLKTGGKIDLEISTFPVSIKGRKQVLAIARDISERKKAEQELKNKTRDLGERVKELNCLYEIANLKTVSGLPLHSLLQKVVQLIPPAWQYPEHAFARIVVDDGIYTSKYFKETDIKQSETLTISNKQSGSIDVFYDSHIPVDEKGPFLEEEGQLLTIIAHHVEDIVTRTYAEQAQKEVEEMFEAISTSAQDAIIITNDNGMITYWNNAAEKIFGFSNEGAMGKDLHTIIASSQDYKRFQKGIIKFQKTGEGKVIGQTVELVAVKKDGSKFPVELSLSSIRIKERWHAIGIVRDITQRKMAEDKLAYLANHDPLTGLPNRALFNDRLSMALAGAHRTGQKYAVLVLDMDRFKLINDTLGHNIGDMLLKATGDRLVSVLRKSDTVSRMGGDEFFILAAITSTANADQIARKIIMAFHEPFIIEDKEISAKLSIGISLYPEDGKDASTLTKKADIAMYYAKESGKNQYHLYSSKDPVHS